MTLIRQLSTAVLMTVVTTLLLGVAYPLGMTALAQVVWPDKANGQLIARDGHVIGSRIIGQAFSGSGYFHSRPSLAGAGYDAASSGGSNLGPTNQKLVDAVAASVRTAKEDGQAGPVPIDMVTASASGLDPHITPANAAFQRARVARERGVSEAVVQGLIEAYTEGRTFGFLGEPRVNVLELNLALDALRK